MRLQLQGGLYNAPNFWLSSLMSANGSVTLLGLLKKMVRHVELNLDKPSHGRNTGLTDRF
jgi:hypothetical protein